LWLRWLSVAVALKSSIESVHFSHEVAFTVAEKLQRR
jgi:hypothetical protein